MIPDSAVRRAYALYKTGASLREAGKTIGITRPTMRYNFLRLKLRLRPGPQPANEGVTRALHARYLKGERVVDLAPEAGCTAATLSSRFRRLALWRHSPGKAPGCRRWGNKIRKFRGERGFRSHEPITDNGVCLICESVHP